MCATPSAPVWTAELATPRSGTTKVPNGDNSHGPDSVDPDPFAGNKTGLVCPDLPLTPSSTSPATPNSALSLKYLTDGSAAASAPAPDPRPQPNGGKCSRRYGPLVFCRSPSAIRTSQFIASLIHGVRENERRKVSVELSLQRLRARDSLSSLEDRERTIKHLEKTISDLDKNNRELRRQLREAVVLLRRSGDDLDKVSSLLSRRCVTALSAIREQNKLIAAEVDRHQKAIQGALLQHLSDSNSLIQAIYTGYQQIVSASQSPEDFSRAEKKARPSSDQHP